MITDPGQLDRRITFQQTTETRNGNGEPVYAWSTYADRWAKIEYGGGSDVVEGDRLLSQMSTKFTVRYDSRLNKGMRIKYKHWYYNIIRLTEQGRNDFLILDCETTDDEDLMTLDTNLITMDSTLYTLDATRW
jgi:SPP1 family predicted phage head-tail adaptor